MRANPRAYDAEVKFLSETTIAMVIELYPWFLAVNGWIYVLHFIFANVWSPWGVTYRCKRKAPDLHGLQCFDCTQNLEWLDFHTMAFGGLWIEFFRLAFAEISEQWKIQKICMSVSLPLPYPKMLAHRLHLLLYFFSIKYIYLKRQTKCELQRQKVAKPCLHLLVLLSVQSARHCLF